VAVPPQLGCPTRDGLTGATSVLQHGRLCDRSGRLYDKVSRLCNRPSRSCNKDSRFPVDLFSNTSSPEACCRARQYPPTPSQINDQPAPGGGGGGRGWVRDTLVTPDRRPLPSSGGISRSPVSGWVGFVRGRRRGRGFSAGRPVAGVVRGGAAVCAGASGRAWRRCRRRSPRLWRLVSDRRVGGARRRPDWSGEFWFRSRAGPG